MDREEIVTAFRQILDESRTVYRADSSFRPGAVVISFGMKCSSGLGGVWGLFEFRGTSFRIYGVAPDLAGAKELPGMFRLLAMVNADMEAGCFEFETESQQIRFRHFVDCGGFAAVPRNFVCDTLLLPFRMFDRYGDSFAALAEGFPDAAMAFGRPRKGNGDQAGHPTSTMEQKAIFAAVKQFLDDAHVRYSTETTPDGHAAFRTRMRLPDSSGSVPQTIEIRDAHMAIHAHFPVKAAPGQIGEAAKFLALANYDLILGNFDLDVETGEIRYRHFLECAGFDEMPVETLCRHCPIPVMMLSQYGDAIAAVATGRSDAESAFAEVKRKETRSGTSGRSRGG